ncbi:MAG: 50S ribosomal protein L9 [Thermodesulfobacteriota bacterium]
MKVVLRDDVENLGTFGAVVQVADGFARNYLIPRGFALLATGGNIAQLGAEREAWQKKIMKSKEDAEKVAASLQGVALEFRRRAGEEEGSEKLFGSVTSMDIEKALKEKGFAIEKKNIHLREPLRHVGEFLVGVKLHPEVRVEVKVSVVKE